MRTHTSHEVESETLAAVTSLGIVAVLLPVVALTLVASAIIEVTGYDGFSGGERFYSAASNVSNPFLALFPLAALIILVSFAAHMETRVVVLTVVGATIVSTLVVVATVCTIWHAFTVQVSIPNSLNTGAIAIGIGDGAWAYRLTAALRALAAGGTAGLALFLARRQRTE
jgi:hypothetical protein